MKLWMSNWMVAGMVFITGCSTDSNPEVTDFNAFESGVRLTEKYIADNPSSDERNRRIVGAACSAFVQTVRDNEFTQDDFAEISKKKLRVEAIDRSIVNPACELIDKYWVELKKIMMKEGNTGLANFIQGCWSVVKD